MVKTKIIATLGPASQTSTLLRKMMFAGMDVARLNFSHGSHAEHANRIALIRQLNRLHRRHMRILGDLAGYRIRIGTLKEPLALGKKETFWLSQSASLEGGRSIPFDYPGDLKDIKKGKYIYIDDGTIALEVIGHAKRSLVVKVLVGGMLKSHKGVNIPDVHLRFAQMTPGDIKDIRFCLMQRLDFIAQSFVRNKQDVLKVKERIGSVSGCKIIAKIENREGIRNIDEILAVSDGIMIARGDLGVSLPIYEVPVLQKQIIRKCNRAKKFVITATQMLESMTENLRPTRAEVSDVANAIIDGTDYVMLSAESAVGKYPVQTVDMMNRVIKYTEKYLRR